jgi:hypothetical protein
VALANTAEQHAGESSSAKKRDDVCEKREKKKKDDPKKKKKKKFLLFLVVCRVDHGNAKHTDTRKKDQRLVAEDRNKRDNNSTLTDSQKLIERGMVTTAASDSKVDAALSDAGTQLRALLAKSDLLRIDNVRASRALAVCGRHCHTFNTGFSQPTHGLVSF